MLPGRPLYCRAKASWPRTHMNIRSDCSAPDNYERAGRLGARRDRSHVEAGLLVIRPTSADPVGTRDLFPPDRRISTRAAGGGMTGILPVSGVGARISGSTPVGGQNTPSDLASLSPRGSARGSVAVVPCGAIVPCCGHRLRRRATRCIPSGRWRGRLSRWRRWRRRSLSGCRAGCRQSCHD